MRVYCWGGLPSITLNVKYNVSWSHNTNEDHFVNPELDPINLKSSYTRYHLFPLGRPRPECPHTPRWSERLF